MLRFDNDGLDHLGSSLDVGPYRIVALLARGGMAELYLARKTGIGGFERFVVVKRIHPHLSDDEDFRAMFLLEARVAAALSHPNIVQVFDAGEHDGTYYFAMEYIHGEDLRKILRAAAKAHHGIDMGVPLSIMASVCAGLHHAHEKCGPDGESLGIVHRDVSPANVIVSYEGLVKVVDFGIARAANSSSVTRAGQRKGKCAYMSPEQAMGRQVDRRSDVFSIGILLWELTTLRRLFKGESDIAIMNSIIHDPIPLPSSVSPEYPPALEAIVMTALAKDPEDRYETALELQLALEAFAAAHQLDTSATAVRTVMVELLGFRPLPWDDLSPLESQPGTFTSAARNVQSTSPSMTLLTPAERPQRSYRWTAAIMTFVAVGLGSVVAWPYVKPFEQPAQALMHPPLAPIPVPTAYEIRPAALSPTPLAVQRSTPTASPRTPPRRAPSRRPSRRAPSKPTQSDPPQHNFDGFLPR